jgi:L-rhamnonate dehydratase
MFESWQAQRGRGGEGGLAVNSMSAIDIALWDIAGKAAGVPIHQLLGGVIRNQIMVYASTSRSIRGNPVHHDSSSSWVAKTTEQMVSECKMYVEQGFKAIKYGWGDFFGSAAQESLAAIREAIGPNIRLMLDCGPSFYLDKSLSLKEKIQITELLEKHDIYFLEEPVHPYDVDEFKKLTCKSPIKIATGESLTTELDFKRFIDSSAIDVAQPDIQQMGMTQFIRVARRTQDAGILCIPHGPWTAILIAGHLNVLSTISNGVMIEYKGFADFEQGSTEQIVTDILNYSIIETPPKVKDGYLKVSNGPGLGLGNFVHESISGLNA